MRTTPPSPGHQQQLPNAAATGAAPGGWAIVGLAALCLLPFLRLAFLAHPYLDDFVFPVMVRQHGLGCYISTMYSTYQGRYASLLLTAIHPLAWGGLAQVPGFVFAFIVFFAGSLLFAGQALLAGAEGPGVRRLAAGSLVLALFLLLLPSPTEALYWQQSALTYSSGSACGLLLLGLVAYLPSRSRPAGLWVAVGALAFLAPGFNEINSCFTVALVPLLALPGRGLRRLSWPARLVLGLALVGTAIATLAPGNFVRQAAMHHTPAAPDLARAALALAYSVFGWLSNGLLLVLTLLLAPTLEALVSQPTLPLARLTARPWLWPAWLLLGLTLCYALCFLAAGGGPPSRTRNVLLLFFLVGWFMSVAGLLAGRVRRGHRLTPLPRPYYAGLLLLLALLLVTDHNFRLRRAQVGAPGNSVMQAYRDWLSGDADRYHHEEEARYALIRNTSADSIVVPPLSRQPETLVWWDISTNGTLWGNRAYAAYFHKKAIAVAPSPVR